MKPLSHRALALLAVALGFALRLPGLGDVPPRWDEGWSIAHAALGVADLLVVTAADVHPPLYYLLLGAWQKVMGIDLFAARALSVMLSTTAVALAYPAAKVWSGSARVAVWAAYLMAWLPPVVYYGGVVRMYAAVPSLVLLAIYGALRPGRRLALIVGAAGAMLTLYHAFWALCALALHALGRAAWRRDWRTAGALAAAFCAAGALFAPWGIFAVPQFLARAATEATTNIGQQLPLDYFIRLGLYDLTLAQPAGPPALLSVWLIIGLGLLVGRGQQRKSTLPLAMIALTILGVAFAARQWAFNARMLIGAAPALAMWMGWALDATAHLSRQRAQSAWVLPSILTGMLLGTHWPISTDLVYAKTLEVFDPYNPHTYHQHIAPRARPSDLVIFNVLSPAGFYALDRRANDPSWSYALTWDPVIEPRQRWEARLGQAAGQHNRLWLVLYRGLAGANGHLRGWMDSHFYPAYAAWGEEEVFYGLYGVAREAMRRVPTEDADWGEVALSAAWLPQRVAAGAILPVQLVWRAEALPDRNYKVFVHAVAADGFLIAQHDAQPLNDLRPMTSWQVGEAVRDNHGLALSADYRGPLRVVVGLYDPDTGQRLRTRAGEEALTLATVEVR